MEKIGGVPVCPGVALGELYVWERASAPPAAEGGGPARELERLLRARDRAEEILEEQYRLALSRLGQDEADIFRLHRMMLEDPDFWAAARGPVEAGQAGARAAALAAGETFARQLRALEDPYLRARADDVAEAARLLAAQLDGGEAPLTLPGPVILAADALDPGELLTLDRDKVLGLALGRAAPSGHWAILARAMGLPAVTGIRLDPAWSGRQAGLDGETGALWLEPDGETRGRLQARSRTQAAAADAQAWAARAPAVTRSGRQIEVCANIGKPEEAAQALAQGADGVGLFRTEFLCLGRADCPGEEEQFLACRWAAQALEGRRVTIRTLDLGGDKRTPWLPPEEGENPALGLRGIRLTLARPDLFVPQLRAILRAAAFGKLAVMFPMVTSPGEVDRARALLDDCRRQLEAEGIPTGPLEVGVMVETPAAALLAHELARRVDFFSIGTNDLTQYTLAADRGNSRVSYLCSYFQPALLRAVHAAASQAKRAGIPVGMCGEAAGDPLMTPLLLAFGLDEFSVSPAAVLPIRQAISRWTREEARALADRVMGLSTAGEVHTCLKANVR